MTITVETGAIIANANSYASAADLSDYADLREITLTVDEDVLLIKAMDALYGRNWKGERVSSTQPLEWPRSGVYRDGQLMASDEIPRELFYGQLALAIAAQDTDLLPTQPAQGKGPLTEITAGEITLKYANSGKVMNVAADASADRLLRVLENHSGLNVVRA